MTKIPDPHYFYKDHLATNQPHTLNYKGTNYTFQFHGPRLGVKRNWLEVTREDGVARKFGPGHNGELVWRALAHADKGWETPQVPAYTEELGKTLTEQTK